MVLFNIRCCMLASYCFFLGVEAVDGGLSFDHSNGVAWHGAAEACNPQECRLRGYCQHYEACVPAENGVAGHWQVFKCGHNMYWNTLHAIQGGFCDHFWDLMKEEQDKYRKDRHCTGYDRVGSGGVPANDGGLILTHSSWLLLTCLLVRTMCG